MVEDLPATANHFKKVRTHTAGSWKCDGRGFPQAQVCDMLALLLSEGDEEGVWEQLSQEDATTVQGIINKSTKKKTKRKRLKKIKLDSKH